MAASTASFGSWSSPITAQHLVAGAAGLSEVVADGNDVWFTESRPEEAGRVALLRWRDGVIDEMTPAGANVRTRVHEYGGGAWWVADGTVWYVDDDDQRLRRLDVSEGQMAEPVVLTPEPPQPRGVRFADGRPTSDKAWYVCVRETHGDDHSVEPVNDLVAIAGDGSGRIELVASGADFYSSPRLSPDDAQIAWVQWDHPNMPWDDTQLWLGQCEDGVVTGARCVGGKEAGEAIVLPGFTANGDLWAVSDIDEWWNLYHFNGEDRTPVAEGSFEVATPGWVFGLSRWIEVDGLPIVARTDPGGDTLADVRSGEVRDDWSAVSALSRNGDGVVFIGARHDEEPSIVRWQPGSDPYILRGPRSLDFEAGFFPDPEHVVFPTSDGEEAHGWFYAPANPNATTDDEQERPPLLVLAHGGPTGRARTELSLGTRYWTSRGFAVVDVDYRGSTGYGRTYRHSLHGRWGAADVDDCIAAAQYLGDAGLVDPDRIVIRGGSAGGLTVLGALAGSDVFAAGASRYGVADLSALAQETHKFEARYCDRLVAPWPEGADIYAARSPINRTEDLQTPMIVLQGDADVIVPPNQAEAIVASLAEQGIAHAYLVFPGVGHGFRDAETIITALESELSFFCAVLGIEPADDLPALDIVGSVNE